MNPLNSELPSAFTSAGHSRPNAGTDPMDIECVGTSSALYPWAFPVHDQATSLAAACGHTEKLSAQQAALGIAYVQESLGRRVLSVVRSGLPDNKDTPHLLYLGPASLCTAIDGSRVQFHASGENLRLTADGVLIPQQIHPPLLVGFVSDDQGDNYAFSANAERIDISAEPVELLALNDFSFRIAHFEHNFKGSDSFCRLSGPDAASLRIELQAAGAILWGAACLGIASAAIDWALEYSSRRVAFGKPVCQHQAVALKLAESVMSLESAEALLRNAASAEISAWPDEALAAQAYAADQAFTIAVNVVRVAGGHGYLRSNPAERWLREIQSIRLLGSSLCPEMRGPDAGQTSRS
jgi:hypothetical protein